MADTILTIQQIEDLFQELTMRMIGLDPDAPANQKRVRIGWPVWPSKGAPGWKINEDVSFLLVNFDDDPITRQTEITYSQADADHANRSASSTRVLRINWTSYGPNSFNDVSRIRGGLFLPEFQELLTANNLALILDVPSPMRSPELFSGQWWDRTSFYARFNEKIVTHSSVPYLNSADVRVITERDGGT